jgi:hypothetical protein
MAGPLGRTTARSGPENRDHAKPRRSGPNFRAAQRWVKGHGQTMRGGPGPEYHLARSAGDRPKGPAVPPARPIGPGKAPATCAGPTGQQFLSWPVRLEERLARWAGRCVGGSYQGLRPWLGEWLALWAVRRPVRAGKTGTTPNPGGPAPTLCPPGPTVCDGLWASDTGGPGAGRPPRMRSGWTGEPAQRASRSPSPAHRAGKGRQRDVPAQRANNSSRFVSPVFDGSFGIRA